jgi:leucyl/phenylalanyl-tRNA--protein transferase
MSHAYYQLPTGRVASLDDDCEFPPLSEALAEPNGLIAIGGDLSFHRLLSAYKQGIFPWFSEGEPVLWWSPNPRMVLFPQELRVTKSLQKTINKNLFEVRFNSAFRQVISACSQTPRLDQAGTWITNDIIEAYCTMHTKGYAICAESWLDGQLVGGCYGIKIANMFYGESMFHHVSDASKVAFVSLVQKLMREGVKMIDCQMKTSHLSSFGAREIPREDFILRLNQLIQAPNLTID